MDRLLGLQWSPVLETGNTPDLHTGYPVCYTLQWSPVLETGNTAQELRPGAVQRVAAMEPGLRDREYPGRSVAKP